MVGDNCKNCSPRCFGNVTGSECVGYNGSTYEELGLRQGDSIQTAVDNLASSTLAIKHRVEECSFCNGKISANFSNQNSTPSIANEREFKTTNTKTYEDFHAINIETKPTENSVILSYNIPDLPENHQVLSADISVEGIKNGYNSKIYSSKELIDGISLRPDNFPANLNSRLKILTPDGEKHVESNVLLDANGFSTTVPFNSTQTSRATLKTQDDVNSHFDNKIFSMENTLSKVSNVKSSYFNGSTQEALIYLLQKVEILEKTIRDVSTISVSVNDPCSGGISQMRNLSEIISDLYSKNCKNASNVQSVSSSLDRVIGSGNANSSSVTGTSSSGGNTTTGTNTGTSSTVGTNTGTNTGTSIGANNMIYAYCCSPLGCKKQLASDPCSGVVYDTLDECISQCTISNNGGGGNAGNSTLETTTGPCDVRIYYNQADSCSNISKDIERILNTSLFPNTYTYTKTDALSVGTGCGYVVKVACGSKFSPEFRTSAYSGVANLVTQIVGWISGNCQCTVTNPCSDYIKDIVIADHINSVNKTAYFEATLNGNPVSLKYERLYKTKVDAPKVISLSDLSAGSKFTVEFEVQKDTFSCKFTKEYTLGNTATPCSGFSITGVQYKKPILSVNIIGGVGPFLYKIDGINSDINNINLNPGSHTIEVTDSNNCKQTFTFSVVAENLDTNCIKVSEIAGTTTPDKVCKPDNDQYDEETKVITFEIQNALSTDVTINFTLWHNCGGNINTTDHSAVISSGNKLTTYSYISYRKANCTGTGCVSEISELKCIGTNTKNYSYCPGTRC